MLCRSVCNAGEHLAEQLFKLFGLCPYDNMKMSNIDASASFGICEFVKNQSTPGFCEARQNKKGPRLFRVAP